MIENENPQLTGLQAIGQLAYRPDVRHIWYNGQTFSLDGYNFWSCRFDNCHLHIGSPHFEMHHCFLDDNTTLYYQGEIVKILRLFNSRHEWMYSQAPFFAPVKHKDGTISIAT